MVIQLDQRLTFRIKRSNYASCCVVGPRQIERFKYYLKNTVVRIMLTTFDLTAPSCFIFIVFVFTDWWCGFIHYFCF